MPKTLADFRPVYVIGIGLHPYQKLDDVPYTRLGVQAVREALDDANIPWAAIESAYTGTALTAMGLSRLMYRHLGGTGIPMVQIENASASGSSAFRQASLDVASGQSDVSIALGVDKRHVVQFPSGPAGICDLSTGLVLPYTHFALLANRHMQLYGTTEEQLAMVAVKNTANGALNKYAQRKQARTLDEILSAPRISGPLTRPQCCPIGQGAAAAIIASEEGIRNLNVDASRAIRVRASVSKSQVYTPGENHDVHLTRTTTQEALEQAGIQPDQLDIVELHDAFSIEEILYIEAMGIAPEGRAGPMLMNEEFHINGRVAISASGGLLAMGHPIGPTGVGQICEITRQLRGEAGRAQHKEAKIGLAHMVGVGAVCVVHVLSV